MLLTKHYININIYLRSNIFKSCVSHGTVIHIQEQHFFFVFVEFTLKAKAKNSKIILINSTRSN